jgi:hypothetical protein
MRRNNRRADAARRRAIRDWNRLSPAAQRCCDFGRMVNRHRAALESAK